MVLGYIPRGELVSPLVALVGVALLGWRTWKGRAAVPKRSLLVVGGLLVGSGLLALFSARPAVEHATTGPEWSLYRSLRASLQEQRCLADEKCAQTVTRLDENIRRKLTRFGIRVDPHAELPLVTPYIYRSQLPFAPTAKHRPQPNVVVIFLESMSEWFVGSYHPERFTLTPNLDAFAQKAMRVTNYYNATTPTAAALVSTLCSVYPPFDEPLNPGYFGVLHCAPETLTRYGYSSTFLRGIEREFSNIGPFLESEKFKVLDIKDIWNDIKESAESWGYSDHQLLAYLRRYMERHTGPEPFFIGLTTVDLHLPFNWRKVPDVFKGPGGMLLNIVSSTDDAFGQFWRWFESSRFGDNTILIVTADHAMFPVPEYRTLRGPDWQPTYYDRIPLFIYSPGHQLPRTWTPEVASSVDLLPSLLHLLGINQQNAFEGTSLFDDRSGVSGILGEQIGILHSNQVDAAGKRYIEDFSPGCDSPGTSYLLTRCEQTTWHNWKRRLIQQSRIWR
jgi:hypothetical protein